MRKLYIFGIIPMLVHGFMYHRRPLITTNHNIFLYPRDITTARVRSVEPFIQQKSYDN